MFKDFKKKIFKKIIQNDVDKIKIIFTNIDFELREDLIFYIKKNNKLCIPFSCEKDILKETHDRNMHAKHQRTYEKLIKTMFMFRMFRKIKQYVKHCSSCQLNQTKKHVFYEELILISTPALSFRKIVMNFILTLFEKFNTILTIFDKIIKRKILIVEQDTTTIQE